MQVSKNIVRELKVFCENKIPEEKQMRKNEKFHVAEGQEAFKKYIRLICGWLCIPKQGF